MSEIHELTSIVPKAVDPVEAWQATARLAHELNGTRDADARYGIIRSFCVSQFQVGEAQFFPIYRNLTDMADRPGKGTAAFLEYVAKLGQPVVVDGLEVEGLSQNQSLPPLLSDPRWKTFLLAPVTSPGRAVGVLVLADPEDREFSAADVARLEAALPQIGMVLDHATLLEETGYKDAYSRALGEIDTMIATYDVTAILRFGVRKVFETIHAEKVLVFIVNPDTGAVRVSVAEGCPYAREGSLVHEPCARLAMQALKQRKLQVMNESDLLGLPGAVRREECREKQAIAVPIMANNSLYGVLEIFEKTDGRPFHRNEVAFVNQVATKLALVIQNTQAYMTINRLNENLEEKVKDRTVQLEKAITTLQETQAQLMQSEKLATIGTLAGGVAHEINNPLAAILANVQLLRMDAEDEDELDSLAMIESGARRCKEIVENLLNYSRQSGKDHVSLLINAALDDTLGLLKHHIRLEQVRVVKDYQEFPPVLGNANELCQVFTNLVVNALDAIADRHPDGKAGTLTLRTRQAGKLVSIEVIDDGCGIDDQALRKIFDPFYTTKQVGKGTGLGLSVSQQILATHGGRIEVESERGKGSTFRVLLPVAHGAEHGTGPLSL